MQTYGDSADHARKRGLHQRQLKQVCDAASRACMTGRCSDLALKIVLRQPCCWLTDPKHDVLHQCQRTVHSGAKIPIQVIHLLAGAHFVLPNALVEINVEVRPNVQSSCVNG